MYIQGKNISFSYNSQHPVFKNISFEYSRPGFHALFGESGVGKSTLAKMIAGMVLPDIGVIDYHALDSVIYTTNQERFPGWQTIEQHFDSVLPQSVHNLWRKMIIDFGIEHCQTARFSELSLGQKNRVNLIRYLFQDNPVLVMDESLANVDETMREAIILRIKQQFPKKCFIYISHHVREVCKFCDHIVVLRPPDKQPQVKSYNGHNLYPSQSLNTEKLEKSMLEIVHAS